MADEETQGTTQDDTKPEEPPFPGPFEIAILPLQNTTLFPETVVPLAVGRDRSVRAVESALSTEEKLIGCLDLAYSALNASNWAEFIVNVPTQSNRRE